MNRLWKFLNSGFGLLILGFALTTVIGTSLTEWYNSKAWERQINFEVQRQNFEWERSLKFELLRRKLDEGQKSIEEISDLINQRFFRLQRVFENVTVKQREIAEENWKSYMTSVEEWNRKLIINQNKLKRLVSEEIAQEFNNYETDNPKLQNPSSIHGKFFIAHNRVRELLRCLGRDDCVVTNEMIDDANKILRDLDRHTDDFVDRVSGLFIKRGLELERFEAEPKMEPSNKANSATANPCRQNLKCSAPQKTYLQFDIQCFAWLASPDLRRYASIDSTFAHG